MAPAVTAAVSDLPPVDLGGRCEILPGSRLPELDSAGGKAYVAKAIKDRRTELFAIVTDRPVPARIDALPAFRGLDNPAVLRLADWGAVDWTPDRRRRFAVLYERPAGRRVMDDLRDTREPVPEDQIIRGLLPSLLLALRELNMRGVTCGGLNPTNLFFKDASTTGGVLIGDCLTVPPGYGQPLLVETIERGMAQPSGRGPGSIADDLYALGVTLLVLHLGRNPLRDLDDDAILKAKMDRGTYPALTAQVRLPQNLIEPLRGLMTDDPRQRWTMADLDLWLQGRRLSPKQPQVPRKGARPFEFGGEELMHCRALARAMCRNPLAAAPLIDRGDVDKWVRRAVGTRRGRRRCRPPSPPPASAGGPPRRKTGWSPGPPSPWTRRPPSAIAACRSCRTGWVPPWRRRCGTGAVCRPSPSWCWHSCPCSGPIASRSSGRNMCPWCKPSTGTGTCWSRQAPVSGWSGCCMSWRPPAPA
ncbi:hypothetical protein [Aerophototrophica crusticola]|uniref:hypothetical protein n=1 Tax=Aerophototrophica crusticola TaxID=1709002 RepID=UPI003850C024